MKMKIKEQGVKRDAGYTAEQMTLLEEEITFLREKIRGLRESRQILMGLLQQQMTAEHNRVFLLEQDIARLKKENLYYKKQALQQKITS